MKKTGRVLLAADLGDEYGFVDINGNSVTHKIVVNFEISSWW